MIHQELYSNNTMHRFELTPNSSRIASESAFNLYGILIIPILLSSILMYNVFQLRYEYFTIPFVLIIVILMNVYFFYKKIILKNDKLKLIIQEDRIQLLGNYQIYFQERIDRLKIQLILSGKDLQPTLKLSGECFQGISIGLNHIETNYPIKIKNELAHPDYWFSDEEKTKILVVLLDLKNNTSECSNN